MSEKKFKGRMTIESMVKADTYSCDGCAQYTFFNAGNVNVTIDGIMVLAPRESFDGPGMHPDVEYFSQHKIEFDLANAPIIKTAVGGSFPPSTTVLPGDPVPVDPRMLIIKTYVK